MSIVYVSDDGALCATDAFGVWTINPGGTAPGLVEVVMNGPAWTTLDNSVFWDPRKTRGRGRVVPGASGTRRFRRRIHETEYPMVMVISGAVFQDGTSWGANKNEGLRQNLAWLAENVTDPPPNGAVYRASTLTSADGLTTLTANIQVLDFERMGHQDEIIPSAILTVVVARGGFREPSS